MSQPVPIDFPRAGDRAELLDFLHGVFLRDNPNHIRFERLFPDLFFADTDEYMSPHAVVRVDGRIAACVGCYPMTLRIAGCTVPIFGIGQVSTGAAHLGKGYMSALMKTQLERARAAGAALVWLGGRHDRYAHFGFETAGLLFQYGFDRRSVCGVPRARAVERLPGNPAEGVPAELLAIRDASFLSVEDTPEGYARRLLRADATFEIWTSTPQGASTPDAWCLYSPKSRRVDELLGSDDGCLEIVAAIAENGPPQGVMAIVPPARRTLSEGLRRACSWIGAPMGSICVLDPERLLAAYAPLLPPGFEPPRDLSPMEFTRACFGPEPSPFLAPFPFHLPDIYHV